MLNSTPLGEVISERQLYRHRTRAGMRIGDARYVDLLRYGAWLVETRHAPEPETSGDPYEKLKERARARNVAIATAGRDIGELPEIADPARKAKAAVNFRYFCESYFPLTFHLAWSDDHLKVINRIEQAVLRGGLFSMAMPRGSGKTTICECACIWAVLNGHREFVCLIGSDEGHACDMLESIKMELDGNELLLADYPEVVFPIQSLDGIANRCNGQLYKGERTHIGWTAKEIVLPTMPGSIASGAIIKVAGITGRIRGMKYKRSDGKTVRPSLVVLDDPQTDESARSLSQCATRESILAGAVLGLAGPGNKISGIMPCTVIRPNDMADNILSRDKHPEWNGERTRMVYSFPNNETLWKRYAELRAESMREGNGGEAATVFYRNNRDAMDEGCVIAWPERFNHDEESAIQHAMNLKLQDEAAFFAEYQNEPLPEVEASDNELTADQIASKTNRMQRGKIPVACNHLSMFIDVQASLLFYLVASWEDDFTGYVIDYGTWPDQHRPYFTLRDARQTLASATKSNGIEGAIFSGLESLTRDLLNREWRRDDGALLRVDRCLIDANWGSSTDVIYQFCRQSAHAGIVMPSHGRFVGASSQPFSEYKRRPGDRVGHNWRIPNVHGKRAVRHVVYDTNYWKTFVHARLAVPMGDRGCLSLFGQAPESHRLLAEQLTSEYRVKTEGRGRTVDEWKLRPERGDNHWFDCLVGSAVAASMQGVALLGMDPVNQKRRERVSFAELQRRNRQ
ncbi:MAG: phage terminase large subunit family protein [Planctomycetes bacterium]|nr:phage terminase large subunit family protein [Planctomycetota bacterium]